MNSALTALIKNKTVLMIARRMQTAVDANQIVVPESGCVVQAGTPDKLLRQGGPYRRMVPCKPSRYKTDIKKLLI